MFDKFIIGYKDNFKFIVFFFYLILIGEDILLFNDGYLYMYLELVC